MTGDGEHRPRRYAPWRWMYRTGRPNGLARFLNHLTARQFSAGVLTGGRGVTLEVLGRASGTSIAFPMAVADVGGQRYLVSMLGDNTNWVRNVRAAGGRAVISHRGRTAVVLEEVPVEHRAPILRRYLAVAPGARPHFPVSRRAPVEEFERIAARYPVFRITPDPAGGP